MIAKIIGGRFFCTLSNIVTLFFSTVVYIYYSSSWLRRQYKAVILSVMFNLPFRQDTASYYHYSAPYFFFQCADTPKSNSLLYGFLSGFTEEFFTILHHQPCENIAQALPKSGVKDGFHSVNRMPDMVLGHTSRYRNSGSCSFIHSEFISFSLSLSMLLGQRASLFIFYPHIHSRSERHCCRPVSYHSVVGYI